MSTQEPQPQDRPLTALPRVEDLPVGPTGYDQDRVKQAFDAFRRHVTQLQTQLRVMQAAGGARTQAEPSGHAVRMDALHMVRAAAELADTMERDAQDAATGQIRRAESDISEKQRELQKHETRIDELDREAQRKRDETLAEARKKAEETIAQAEREAQAKVREAEAAAARLLEQARHQATDLTNAARAEIDRSIDWARAEAAEIHARGRSAAEQLLSAAGLSGDALEKVVAKIVGPPSPPKSAGDGSDAAGGG